MNIDLCSHGRGRNACQFSARCVSCVWFKLFEWLVQPQHFFFIRISKSCGVSTEAKTYARPSILCHRNVPNLYHYCQFSNIPQTFRECLCFAAVVDNWNMINRFLVKKSFKSVNRRDSTVTPGAFCRKVQLKAIN